MRVLTFLHSYEPGGVERIAFRLVRQWRAMGVDAPIFLGRNEGAMATDAGADLDAEVPQQPWCGTAWWETLWMIAKLPAVIRRLKPDVLFCAGNSYTIVAVAMKLLLGRDCPPVVAKISNDLERRNMPAPARVSYYLWLRVQARFLDYLVGMADPTREEITHFMGVGDEAVTIIPDPALSRQLVEAIRAVPPHPVDQNGGRKFVTVARLAHQKNLPLMLRAFAKGARAQDSLTIVGIGPMQLRLERLARDLGIDDKVEFAGHIAHPALMLRQFDIFLLSSDYEGVPAVILEALAAGLPIITTRCSPSIAWLLEGAQNCHLVATRDEAALASKIALATPGQSGTESMHFSAEDFYVETAASSYLKLFMQAGRSEPSSLAA